MHIEHALEALLFYRTEPTAVTDLPGLLNVSLDDVTNGLALLDTSLKTRGIRLLHTDTHVQLVTAPEAQPLIDTIRTQELSADIGKSGAETLAIILYKGPVSRSEIDSIRGVNSTFILRNLLVRGLIERRPHPHDNRSFVYAITPELYTHLGATTRESLPDFEAVMNALEAFEKNAAIESS